MYSTTLPAARSTALIDQPAVANIREDDEVLANGTKSKSCVAARQDPRGYSPILEDTEPPQCIGTGLTDIRDGRLGRGRRLYEPDKADSIGFAVDPLPQDQAVFRKQGRRPKPFLQEITGQQLSKCTSHRIDRCLIGCGALGNIDRIEPDRLLYPTGGMTLERIR